MIPGPRSPYLICITGLPGCGKSYFAIRLAKALGIKHLNSDRLRNRMGLRGDYSKEAKSKVYQSLQEECKQLLSAGTPVVLDSTFYQKKVRTPYRKLGKELGIKVYWVEITAAESTIAKRINVQRPYSQADFEVYKIIKEKYEQLPDLDLQLRSEEESIEEMIYQVKTMLGMMTTHAVEGILERGALPDSAEDGKLIETHASWVILSTRYAFKIKKPVHFSFMDFSTLEKRKYFCFKELELNRRLTKDVYIDVLEVRQSYDGPVIGATTGEIIDYAVRLKRMDESLRMENLLQQGEIELDRVQKIAVQLADFHRQTTVIETPWELSTAQLNFLDIKKIRPFIVNNFGQKRALAFDRILLLSNQFLKCHAERFEERTRKGFVRDGHGDLHSGNIFLYPDPVLFDCIEFNEGFRILDLLDELAFLTMDLEYHQRKDLADEFLKTYRREFEIIEEELDERILTYFQLYRANVRLKVTALKDQLDPKPEDLAMVDRYLHMMEEYAELLFPR